MRTRTARREQARKHKWEFQIIPGSRHPFKHAKAMAEEIAKIRDAKVGPEYDFKSATDQEIALHALPLYRSRGHGGRHRTKNASGAGRTLRDRSKYDPAEEDLKHTPKKSLTQRGLDKLKALHL